MVGTKAIAIDKAWLCEIPTFKKSRFQMVRFQIPTVLRYSDSFFSIFSMKSFCKITFHPLHSFCKKRNNWILLGFEFHAEDIDLVDGHFRLPLAMSLRNCWTDRRCRGHWRRKGFLHIEIDLGSKVEWRARWRSIQNSLKNLKQQTRARCWIDSETKSNKTGLQPVSRPVELVHYNTN